MGQGKVCLGRGGVLLTETNRIDSKERQGNGEGLLCPGIKWPSKMAILFSVSAVHGKKQAGVWVWISHKRIKTRDAETQQEML